MFAVIPTRRSSFWSLTMLRVWSRLRLCRRSHVEWKLWGLLRFWRSSKVSNWVGRYCKRKWRRSMESLRNKYWWKYVVRMSSGRRRFGSDCLGSGPDEGLSASASMWCRLGRRTPTSQGTSCGCFVGISSTRGECSSKDTRWSRWRSSWLSCHDALSETTRIYPLQELNLWTTSQHNLSEETQRNLTWRNRQWRSEMRKWRKGSQNCRSSKMERKERVRWLLRVTSRRTCCINAERKKEWWWQTLWKRVEWTWLEQSQEDGSKRKSEKKEVKIEILPLPEE